MNRLIHGDAIKEMQKMIDEGVKVDCIVTDPPYEFVQGGCSSKKVNGGKKFAKNGVIDKTMANFKKKDVIEMLEITKKYLMERTMDIFSALNYSCRITLIGRMKIS